MCSLRWSLMATAPKQDGTCLSWSGAYQFINGLFPLSCCERPSRLTPWITFFSPQSLDFKSKIFILNQNKNVTVSFGPGPVDQWWMEISMRMNIFKLDEPLALVNCHETSHVLKSGSWNTKRETLFFVFKATGLLLLFYVLWLFIKKCANFYNGKKVIC